MFVLVACGRGVDCIKADLSGAGSLGKDTLQHADRERSVFGSLSGQETDLHIKHHWWSHLCLSIYGTICQAPQRKMKTFRRHRFLSRQQKRTALPSIERHQGSVRAGRDCSLRRSTLVSTASRLNRPGFLFETEWLRVTTSLLSMKPIGGSGHFMPVLPVPSAQWAQTDTHLVCGLTRQHIDEQNRALSTFPTRKSD